MDYNFHPLNLVYISINVTLWYVCQDVSFTILATLPSILKSKFIEFEKMFDQKLRSGVYQQIF